MKKLDLTGLGDLAAAATQRATDGTTYDDVQLGHIRISRTNRKRFNTAALQELAANIKEVGIIQPILIRPVTPTADEPEVFEIVAGERRYRAANIAGLGTIPAMCRTLTDRQAREIQLLENLQREDPHPMEEAEGFQELMLAGGYNADQLADKLKKSRSYIYGRLKLCALTLSVRTQFLADEITASTALLIARIPVPALQVKAVGEILAPFGHSATEPMSYRKAVEHIQQRYMLDLAAAPFSLTDAKLLTSAGACSQCPKRTGNQPVIFADVTSADVCTDPDCFAEKRAAHSARTIVQANKTGIPIFEGSEASKKINAQWDSDATLITDFLPFWKMNRTVESKNGNVGAILGAALPAPAAYAKKDDGTVTALYDKSQVQHELECMGLCVTAANYEAWRAAQTANPDHLKALAKQSAAHDAQALRRDEAEKQTASRVALYKRLRGEGVHGLCVGSLRAVAKHMYAAQGLPNDVLDIYDFDNGSEEDVIAHIDQAAMQEVLMLMVDMILGGCLVVSPWQLDRDDGDGFDTVRAMAAFEGVDLEEPGSHPEPLAEKPFVKILSPQQKQRQFALDAEARGEAQRAARAEAAAGSAA